MFQKNSTLSFHQLRMSVTPDVNELFAVARWDTDVSLKIDEISLLFLTQLVHGKSISEATKISKLDIKTAYRLVHSFIDAGFISRIGHKKISDQYPQIKPLLVNLHSRSVKWIISKPFQWGAMLFIVGGIIIGLLESAHIPSYTDFFWTEDIYEVFLSLFLIDTVLVIGHELAHFLVTKAVGGEATIRISNRFIYLVFETESYHLAVIPKALRFYVYLAGMIFDMLVIASMYWIFSISNLFGWELGSMFPLMKTIILIEVIGIIWEFNVYVETDMYNFFQELFDFEDLRGSAKKYIQKKIDRTVQIIGTPFVKNTSQLLTRSSTTIDDFRYFRKKEKRILIVYCMILLLGLLFTGTQFVIFSIPRDLHYLKTAAIDLVRGWQDVDLIVLFKSSSLIFLILHEYVLLLYFRTKHNKQHDFNK